MLKIDTFHSKRKKKLEIRVLEGSKNVIGSKW